MRGVRSAAEMGMGERDRSIEVRRARLPGRELTEEVPSA